MASEWPLHVPAERCPVRNPQTAFEACFAIDRNYTPDEATGLAVYSREGRDDHDHLYVQVVSKNPPQGRIHGVDEILSRFGHRTLPPGRSMPSSPAFSGITPGRSSFTFLRVRANERHRRASVGLAAANGRSGANRSIE